MKSRNLKQKSTLSLLQKNVNEMESIIRTKNFEIKKLRNNLKAMGVGTSSFNDDKEKKLKRKNEELSHQMNEIKKSEAKIYIVIVTEKCKRNGVNHKNQEF
eukprot:TRINITY_DN30043_c0_g1_i1.p1 TRINITY_DN30043_c0_g1~~TRINITY_DN30043_c0_g1_i1.p1  ORF type:complete len:101 (+),score=11.70 TRINITY_DN30043_c0_g1_i1:83-385(+)